MRWLGAVQSQDYAGAKWALALRTNGVSDAALDRAFADGAILRTHVMRPTWHFVTPEDIRWMLKLTAPRVYALSAYYYRQLELDDALFARSDDVLVRALEGGKQLTRAELGEALEQAGVDTKEQLRLAYIVGHAELEGLICSGGRRGKQYTYALLDERAPQARALERDEALAELAGRYFASHGPATLHDFAWWSGLTATDAKAGLDMVKTRLEQAVVDEKTYWFAPSPPAEETAPSVYLLPNYDEYTVAYTDRSAIFDEAHTKLLDSRGNFLFNHVLVIDGQVTGTWKRTVKTREVVVELNLFATLSAAQRDAVAAAVQRYGEFLGLPVNIDL